MAKSDEHTDDSLIDRLSAAQYALSLRDSKGQRIFYPGDFFPYYWEPGDYFYDPMPRIQAISKNQPYTDPEPEDLMCRTFHMNSMIRNSMKLHSITVSNSDPDYLKIYVLQAEALFQCTGTRKLADELAYDPDWPESRHYCNNEWKCYNATIVIDLVNQKVSKRYQQWCRRCLKQLAIPHFTNRQLAQIVERIIKCYHRRKKAGGTVPSVENNGSHSPKAFEPHEEVYCNRCTELKEPCWLYLVPYFKKVPLSMISFVRLSLETISESLSKVCAKATLLVARGRICINPLSGSENIKQWRKQCETILELFLKGLTCVTVPLQPELLPKIQGAIRTPQTSSSLSIKEKVVLQIAGDATEVSELSQKVKYIEDMVKEQKLQDELRKRKPCIILW